MDPIEWFALRVKANARNLRDAHSSFVHEDMLRSAVMEGVRLMVLLEREEGIEYEDLQSDVWENIKAAVSSPWGGI